MYSITVDLVDSVEELPTTNVAVDTIAFVGSSKSNIPYRRVTNGWVPLFGSNNYSEVLEDSVLNNSKLEHIILKQQEHEFKQGDFIAVMIEDKLRLVLEANKDFNMQQVMRDYLLKVGLLNCNSRDFIDNLINLSYLSIKQLFEVNESDDILEGIQIL